MHSDSTTLVRATVTLYSDNGQLAALVEWSDGATTWGHPRNTHMRALLHRTRREGLPLALRRTERKPLSIGSRMEARIRELAHQA